MHADVDYSETGVGDRTNCGELERRSELGGFATPKLAAWLKFLDPVSMLLHKFLDPGMSIASS